MNKVNYQRELDKLLEELIKVHEQTGEIPKLFLHSCCAPCSSYCLEYLCKYFSITVFYYNPNITADAEYKHRVEEQKRLIKAYNDEKKGHRIEIVEGEYDPKVFLNMAKGLEKCPEGGERCFKCYELRLRETARLAAEGHFDYFCTTLSISPLKNAEKLNEIGQRISEEYHIPWLVSDFKKKNGYKRSVELSAEYDLYRQNYCGCAYSKAQANANSENVGSHEK